MSAHPVRLSQIRERLATLALVAIVIALGVVVVWLVQFALTPAVVL